MDISMNSKDDEIIRIVKFEDTHLNSVNDNHIQLLEKAANDDINS